MKPIWDLGKYIFPTLFFPGFIRAPALGVFVFLFLKKSWAGTKFRILPSYCHDLSARTMQSRSFVARHRATRAAHISACDCVDNNGSHIEYIALDVLGTPQAMVDASLREPDADDDTSLHSAFASACSPAEHDAFPRAFASATVAAAVDEFASVPALCLNRSSLPASQMPPLTHGDIPTTTMPPHPYFRQYPT